MKLSNKDSKKYFNSRLNKVTALSQTTHLCIAAHEDDIEFMAYSAIVDCYSSADKWFCGVCVANGENSPRSGKYKDYTNEQMVAARIKEQISAAKIGNYNAQFLLGYKSVEIGEVNPNLEKDLKKIILATQPQVIYTHNPADAHSTHIAVCLKVIKVLKELSSQYKPQHFLGCEVWRDLDWLPDCYKIQQSTAGNEKLERKILSVFKTQIEGGKNYGEAVMCRRRANATFAKSHSIDIYTSVSNFMDLMPLLDSPSQTVEDFITERLSKYSSDILSEITKLNK